jgi:hypothetical protein
MERMPTAETRILHRRRYVLEAFKSVTVTNHVREDSSQWAELTMEWNLACFSISYLAATPWR